MLLKPLENIFKYFVNRRNRKYDNGDREIIAISKPVISIGALSAGGAGKTPFAIYLANKLNDMGKRPLVICRGYKREIKGMTIVSDGKNLLADIAHSGDEPTLIAKSANCAVISNESKSQAALFSEKNINFDVAIIDDGFQHRRLKRDFDIVIIDKATLEKPYMFPRGLLREEFSSLKRADAIAFINGAEPNSKVLEHIRSNSVIIKCSTAPSSLINAITNQKYENNGESFYAITAIAKAQRFFDSLLSLNINISATKSYSDHYRFKARDIEKIISKSISLQSKNVICTEKDAVKLLEFKDMFIKNNLNLISLPIKLSVEDGEAELIKAIEKLF